MVSVLTGPDDKKCWFCEALEQKKNNHIGIWYDLNNNKDVFIETFIRYCPHCGKELLDENKYRELYAETFNKDERLFAIKGEIATEELMEAMLNAQKEYHNEYYKEEE